MNSEIISVGTELLLGDVVNTNASWISKELSVLGINCYYHTVVGDNTKRLSNTLKLALSRSELIFLTGGLGPTYDDLTREVVSETLGLKLGFDDSIYNGIVDYFKRMERVPTENNKRQAYVPEGATVLHNSNGTAPGLLIENKGRTIILLPGPPHELREMFETSVFPYLVKEKNMKLVSHRVYLYGIGESSVEDLLETQMKTYTNPTIAPYANENGLHLRITASGDTIEEAEKIIKPVLDEVLVTLSEYVYSVDIPTLEETLVNELMDRNLTISTAESCTAGHISERITRIPGSSKVFNLGVSVYEDAMKTKILSVKEDTLTKYGAVSKETALEMVAGIQKISNTDIAISVTGILGPGGGSLEKPVGTVYIGLYYKGAITYQLLKLDRLTKDRRLRIRSAASSYALKMVLDCLKEDN